MLANVSKVNLKMHKHKKKDEESRNIINDDGENKRGCQMHIETKNSIKFVRTENQPNGVNFKRDSNWLYTEYNGGACVFCLVRNKYS